MKPYERNEAIFNKYQVTEDDVKRMAELAEMDFGTGDLHALSEEEIFDELFKDFDLNEGEFPADPNQMYGVLLLKRVQGQLADAALSTMHDIDSFYDYWHENKESIRDAAQLSPAIKEMLVLGFRMAISVGSAASANCLGALYYMGDVVEQDYAKAAELYELAMAGGCYQSIINLGYIYEYGRIGKPDHAKAYEFYSLAAALAPSCEAIYKLGDMFSRGRAVKRDMKKAFALYERSLQMAQSDEEYAQPAIRIAQILIDPDCFEYDIDPDPLRALALFQRAEIGLRLDIADGQFYYKKRLQEAIEGQEIARAMVEDEGDGGDFFIV